MPTLDTLGKIAAAQIGFYVPIAAFTIVLVFRYAFRRDAGWLFLCIFALGEPFTVQASVSCLIILAARIAGGALIVAGELVVPTKIDLFLAAYILQPAGLALLLLATIGFIGLAYVVPLYLDSYPHLFSVVARVPTAKCPVYPSSSEWPA